MNRRFAFVCLHVFLFSGIHLMAQQAVPPLAPSEPQNQNQSSAQPGDYVLKVSTQLVDLDVVVTDKQGNIVDNLSKNDFKVTEDKQPQTILNFDRPLAHVLPSNLSIDSTQELDRAAPEAPVSIIVLDEINTRFEDEVFARYSLERYLKTQSDMLPQPTMLVAITLDHFIVLHDYTTSKKEIVDALDHHFIAYPWRSNGNWQSEQISQAFASLRQVAQATAGHRGHKNMIWIGRGFPSIQMQNMLDVDRDALETAIASCTNMLRDARITLYTVDPAGISAAPTETDVNGGTMDDPFGGEVDFNALATATGGRTFLNRNDVDNLIGKSVRDGSEFYTLAYKPTTRSDDPARFRKIHVIMKDPHLIATTREGYYVQPTSPSPAKATTASSGTPAAGTDENDLAVDLNSAADSTMVYDGLPITVTRDATNPNQFSIHIAASGLDWTGGGESTPKVQLALVVSSFDRKGKLLNRDARMLNVPAKSSEPHSLDLQTRIDTASPAARIRFVVRDASSGKVGADNAYLIDKKLVVDPAAVNPQTPSHRRH
jgi:VWFA-related protein